jgi:hypothetical protein
VRPVAHRDGRAAGPMAGVWGLGALALALLGLIAWMLADLEPGVLDLQFAFSPRAFGEVVHAWSAEQLAAYRWHLVVDGLLLGVYGAFGVLFVGRSGLFAHVSARLTWLARACLPLAAVFDGAENALHGWLTAAPRFGVPAVYAASGVCASLKWALLLLFVLLVAHALRTAADAGE